MHTLSLTHSLAGWLAGSLSRSQQAPPTHFIACLQLQWDLAAERDLSIVVDAAPLEPESSATRATLGDTSKVVQKIPE